MAKVMVLVLALVTLTGVQTSPVTLEGEAALVWTNVLRMIEKFTPVSEEVSSDACRVHGRAFLEGVRELQPWAIQMLDASSKFPSGVMGGNIKEFGQYDECVEARGQLSVEMAATSPGIESVFSGQYCLANVHLSSDSTLSPLHLQVENLLNTMTLGRRGREIVVNRTVQDTLVTLPSLSLVQWSVCVPSSCSPRDVQLTLDRALGDLAQHAGLRVSTQLFPESCSSIPPPGWSAGEMAMIALLTMLGTAVAFASTYHLLRQPSPQDSTARKILLAFAFPPNWSRLFSMEEAPRNSVTSMDGIRTINTLWVIFAHELNYLSTGPMVNKHRVVEGLTNMMTMPLHNNTPSVDTFLLLSGLLKAFLNLKEMDRDRFNLASSYVRRYLRLTPAYSLMIAFYATLLPRLGNGPEWTKHVGYPSEICRSPENWLMNLLYINNYVYNGTWCIMESWSLSVDMQCFVLSPLLIIPLWRWPRRGLKLLLCALVVSVLIPLATTYRTSELPTFILGMHDIKITNYVMRFYPLMHNRMAPYIVGISLGYVLFKIGSHGNFKLSKLSVVLGWTSSLLLMQAVIFGPYQMVQMDYQYDLLKVTLYGGLHRFAWAAAVAWIIFACHLGYGGWVNGLLSARVFQPLSRLSYSMFLAHAVVLRVGAGLLRHAFHHSEFDLIRSYLGNLSITLIASIFLHLFVEAPAAQLTNLLYAKGTPGKVIKQKLNETARLEEIQKIKSN